MAALRIKQIIAAGGAAAVLVGGALGIAAAQQTNSAGSPGASPANTSTSTSSGPNGTGPGAQAYQQYINDLAQRLNVTPQQLQQAMQGARQDVGSQGRGNGAPGQGQGRPGPGGMQGPMQQMLNTAAQAIGISPQQLLQELPGSTLSQVAQNHGVAPSTVQNALTSEADQLVSQQIQNLMTRQFPQHPAGPNGGPGAGANGGSAPSPSASPTS